MTIKLIGMLALLNGQKFTHFILFSMFTVDVFVSRKPKKSRARTRHTQLNTCPNHIIVMEIFAIWIKIFLINNNDNKLKVKTKREENTEKKRQMAN